MPRSATKDRAHSNSARLLGLSMSAAVSILLDSVSDRRKMGGTPHGRPLAPNYCLPIKNAQGKGAIQAKKTLRRGIPARNSSLKRRRYAMAYYMGIHTLPGFTKEMLTAASPALEKLSVAGGSDTHFLRALTSFKEGRVVCEFDAPSKDS